MPIQALFLVAYGLDRYVDRRNEKQFQKQFQVQFQKQFWQLQQVLLVEFVCMVCYSYLVMTRNSKNMIAYSKNTIAWIYFATIWDEDIQLGRKRTAGRHLRQGPG